MVSKKHWATMLLTSLCMHQAVAQSWSPEGSGLTAPTVSIADITTPSAIEGWAIGTVLYPSGFGGVAVPAFMRLANGGSMWTGGIITPMPADHSPSSITAVDSNTAWISSYSLATLETGKVFKTTDAGMSWTDQSPAGMSDAARFVHFYDANEGLLVGDSSVYRSNDGGTTWTFSSTLPIPFGGEAAGFLFNASEVKGDYLWLGDVYGYFYKSKDRGHTWAKMPGNVYPNAIKGIAFRDSSYGLAIASHFAGGGSGGGASTDDGILHRTTDGGATWTDVTFTVPGSNVPNYYAKYDIAYLPGTANTFVLTSEYNGGFSAISQDGGDTWRLIDSNVQHTACAFPDQNTGWSGGYMTSDTTGMFRWLGTTTAIHTVQRGTLQCFPNPATDKLMVQLPAPVAACVLMITGMDGKTVYRNTNWQPNQPVDLHGLANGTYQLQLTNEQNIYTGRFTKQ